MNKLALRIVLLSAAFSTFALPALVRAADDTPPKPAPTERPTRGRFNPADILKNYRDQFEGVNLTDDQMKKIDGFIETAQADVKKAGEGNDRESRGAAFAALGKLRENVNSILTDAQKGEMAKKRNVESVKRFKDRYSNPELKLTDEQKSKLEAVYADYLAELGKLTPGTGGFDRDAFRKRGELSRSEREKAKAILTPEQQKLLPADRGTGRRNRGGAPGTNAA